MEKKEKLTRNIVWIAISIVTMLTAVLFIIQALRIYFGNNGTYTKDIVGKYLLQILFSMILWVLVVCAGGILSFKHKLNDNRSVKHGKVFILNNLLRMLPKEEVAEDPLYLVIKKEDKKRKIGWLVTFISLAVCALFVFLYVFNKKNYDYTEPNEVIVKLVSHILPFVIVGFVISIAMIIFESYSANLATIYAKKLLAKYKKVSVSLEKETIKKRNILIGVKCGVLILAIAMIIIGAVNGGATSVFFKAANICSECIGLG